ncbi:MAG: hypothetical protein IJ190_01770 [Prevotella sp.]|nr:hypothetical protein [Prevotella sp.]
MIKDVILEKSVFQLKSKPNCLVEIVKAEDSKVKVSVYNEKGNEYDIVDISDLKGISLSTPILKSLGFEEKEGRLMSLIYEHYWQKQVNEYLVWIVDDKGILKYATIDANAFHGVKFLPAPFLHELQNIIGTIDVPKLFKDLKNN